MVQLYLEKVICQAIWAFSGLVRLTYRFARMVSLNRNIRSIVVGWDDGNVAKTRHCAWHLGSCNLEFLLTLGSYQFSVQQEEKDITGVLPHVPKLRCPFWGSKL